MLSESHITRMQALPRQVREHFYAQLYEKYKDAPKNLHEQLAALIAKIETPRVDLDLLAHAPPPSLTKRFVALALFHFKINGEKWGLFSLFFPPLMNILVVFIIASFLHAPTIYDMPTFPFAVIGVTCWLIFRQTFVALLQMNIRLLNQEDHYCLTPSLLLLSGVVKPIVVQLILAFALLFAAVMMGEAPLPTSLLLQILLFLLCALYGIGAGLVARLLTFYLPIKTFLMFALRGLSLLSGLFFVSEQLPAEISEWLLLNPLLHLTQLARAAWFESYVSADASLGFVALALLPLFLLGLICQFHVREKRACV